MITIKMNEFLTPVSLVLFRLILFRIQFFKQKWR